MILNRRSLIAASAAAGAAALLPRAAAAADPAMLAPGAMRADLDLMRDAYESVHPGLARYLRSGEFGLRVEAAKRRAGQERSLAEMFLMLARLTASVRCGHTYPNPNNQREAVKTALFGGRDRLPLAFRWIDGRMIVTGGRGGPPPIAPGSEILAIDGVPARGLLARLMPLARADGGNDGKRLMQLGLDPRERYAAFDVYRAAMMPPRAPHLLLRVRSAGGVDRTVELQARTEQELAASHSAQDATLGWTFGMGADRLGRLTMPDWATYHSRWDWRGFIDGAIDRSIDERARGLIVDLRGNEGGTECGWYLLERIVARDTPLPRFQRRVRYRRLPEHLRGPLDTWDDSFKDWGSAAREPVTDGFFTLHRAEDEAALVRPRGKRFTGPVVVLVDAACSSATFQFANAVRSTGCAQLVGETTGGNRRGINGDAYFFVRLPGTGLEVDLPIVGHFAEDVQPDAGVVPDVLVPLSASDVSRGFDRQLHVAFQRISNS